MTGSLYFVSVTNELNNLPKSCHVLLIISPDVSHDELACTSRDTDWTEKHFSYTQSLKKEGL